MAEISRLAAQLRPYWLRDTGAGTTIINQYITEETGGGGGAVDLSWLVPKSFPLIASAPLVATGDFWSSDITLSLSLNSTGGLETSGGTLRVKLDTPSYLNRGAGGMSLAAHPIISLHSHSGGSALDVVGLSGASTLAMLTPSSDVGTTAAAAILKSTGFGGLTLRSLTTTGSINVTAYESSPGVFTGGDLTVGANIFFVDSSQGNVGINRAPDPQFDLDVAGALRAQYLVGKQALEVKDVLLLCQYDGWEPFQTNFYGQPDGHRGQPATITAHNFRQGKFGKSLACSPAMTNLVLNPSFTASTTGWTFSETGTGGSIARGSPIAQEDWLTSEGVGQWAGILTASNNGSASVTAVNLVSLPNGQTVTLSLMVRATSIAAGSAVIRDSTNGVDRATINLTPLTGGWQRVSTSWTNSTGGAVQISVRLYNTATSGTILFTNVQLEQTAFYTPYNDGDMPAGAWSGTQYASASTRVAVTASYQTDGNINQGGGAVMAWIRCVPTGGSQFVLRAIGTSAGEINLFVNSSGYLYGQWGTSSVTSTAVVADGTWHFVTITKGGSQVILYADGVQVATGTGTGFSGLPTLMSVGNNLAGRIDVLCTVNRVLPAKEILAIYNSDAPVFAVSSVFSFRLSESGLVWGDAEGLWVRDRNGDAVMGVYGALAGGKSWGGVSLNTGDILFGRYGASDGGWLLFDRDGVSSKPFLSLGYADKTVFALDSGGATLDGVLDISANGGIIQGSGTQGTLTTWSMPTGNWGSDNSKPTWGSFTGLRVGRSGSVGMLALYNAGLPQIWSGTNGYLYFASGNGWLNENGLTLRGKYSPFAGSGDEGKALQWIDNSSTLIGEIVAVQGSFTDQNRMEFEVGGAVVATMYNNSGTKYIDSPVGSFEEAQIDRITLGNAGGDNIGRMKPSGTITVANNGTTVLNAAVRCMITIFVSDGNVAQISCDGATGTYIHLDRLSRFSTTAGTASKTNVYVTSSNITLENKAGGSRNYEVIIIGGTAL